MIDEELCVGVVRDASREAFRGVIRRLVDAGAQGVVLGCTELGLLVGPGDRPVPLSNTTRLHVGAGVALPLEPREQ